MFKPGQPRPAGAGRAKGTPNKDTLSVAQKLKEHGIDLIDELMAMAPELSIEIRVKLYRELLDYVHPKRKALEVELSGQLETGPQVVITLPSNAREIVKDVTSIVSPAIKQLSGEIVNEVISNTETDNKDSSDD